MNSVHLMGRITKDIELRHTQSDMAFISFIIAVNRPTKDSKADFISCKAFGKTAEFINKYFSKGNQIALDGKLQSGSYEKDGRKVFTLDVVVESVFFTGTKKDNQYQALEAQGNDELPWEI